MFKKKVFKLDIFGRDKNLEEIILASIIEGLKPDVLKAKGEICDKLEEAFDEIVNIFIYIYIWGKDEDLAYYKMLIYKHLHDCPRWCYKIGSYLSKQLLEDCYRSTNLDCLRVHLDPTVSNICYSRKIEKPEYDKEKLADMCIEYATWLYEEFTKERCKWVELEDVSSKVDELLEKYK